MHKLLLSQPRIGSYSALLLAGLVAGYALTRWQAVRSGIKGAHIDNLVLVITILSLFGARLFSWLFYFPPGVGLWQALWDPSGGMVFYGGMIFGLVTLVTYARIRKLDLSSLMDVFAPGLALGLAFGRIGCLMAGCCWGDVCVDHQELAKTSQSDLSWQIRTVPFISTAHFPLAVRFPPGAGAYEQHRKLGLIDEGARQSLPVHPVQLYESALALLFCVFLCRRFSRRRWNGEMVCLFLFGYAGIRFFTELFRADNPPIYFGLTLSQVISLMLAGLAAIVWFGRKGEVSHEAPECGSAAAAASAPPSS